MAGCSQATFGGIRVQVNIDLFSLNEKYGVHLNNQCTVYICAISNNFNKGLIVIGIFIFILHFSRVIF